MQLGHHVVENVLGLLCVVLVKGLEPAWGANIGSPEDATIFFNCPSLTFAIRKPTPAKAILRKTELEESDSLTSDYTTKLQ